MQTEAVPEVNGCKYFALMLHCSRKLKNKVARGSPITNGKRSPHILPVEQVQSAAVKHVVFGLSVFAASADIHISDTSSASEHLDLCLKHADLVGLQHVHVNEYELGECPQQPHNKKA